MSWLLLKMLGALILPYREKGRSPSLGEEFSGKPDLSQFSRVIMSAMGISLIKAMYRTILHCLCFIAFACDSPFRWFKCNDV